MVVFCHEVDDGEAWGGASTNEKQVGAEVVNTGDGVEDAGTKKIEGNGDGAEHRRRRHVLSTSREKRETVVCDGGDGGVTGDGGEEEDMGCR